MEAIACFYFFPLLSQLSNFTFIQFSQIPLGLKSSLPLQLADWGGKNIVQPAEAGFWIKEYSTRICYMLPFLFIAGFLLQHLPEPGGAPEPPPEGALIRGLDHPGRDGNALLGGLN